MQGVLAQVRVVFDEFQPVLRVLLVLTGGVNALTVLGAYESDNFSVVAVV